MNFDSKFLELQTKVAAVLQMLITEYPDAAAKAKLIINDYATYQAEQETIQADTARANAIAALITEAGQMLADIPDLVVPNFDPPLEPEPEPEPEP